MTGGHRNRHVVAAARDIPPGSRKLIEVAGRSIALFNVGGEFFAILDRCPHQGGSLCGGELIGLVESREPGEYRYTRPSEILRCPWHGWEFDILTGRSIFNPHRTRVKAYDVTIEADAQEPEDESVETFEVRVEDGWVVLHI